jgi:outer membrane cobalamin receptor
MLKREPTDYDSYSFYIGNEIVYYNRFGRFFTQFFYHFKDGFDKSYVCLDDKDHYIKTKRIAAKYSGQMIAVNKVIELERLNVYNEPWNYEPIMAKYNVTIKYIRDNKIVGNLAITKRHGNIENIGYCFNTERHDIRFEPAVINGVRVYDVWATIVMKELKYANSGISQEGFFSEDDILMI